MAKTTVAKSRGQQATKHGKPQRTVKRGGTGKNRERQATIFSQRKSIEELAAEQGVNLEGQLERVLGSGAYLWDSDEDFEKFVKGIYDRRRQDLIRDKQ